jgi:hypothetical protein
VDSPPWSPALGSAAAAADPAARHRRPVLRPSLADVRDGREASASASRGPSAAPSKLHENSAYRVLMRGAASSRRCVGSLDDASGRLRAVALRLPCVVVPAALLLLEPCFSFGSSARSAAKRRGKLNSS